MKSKLWEVIVVVLTTSTMMLVLMCGFALAFYLETYNEEEERIEILNDRIAELREKLFIK